MALTWLHPWVQAKSHSLRRDRRRTSRQPTFRPYLELLEPRLAPATRTWDGGGTTNNWSDRFNWTGDVAPVAGDDLIFPQTAARKTAQVVNLPINTVFDSITYSGNGYTVLPSNLIRIRLLVASNPTGSNTFRSSLKLDNNIGPQVVVQVTNAGATLNLNGVLSGSDGLLKNGAGTLVLGGDNANTYQGTTSVAAGTLVLGKDTALGSTAAGTSVAAGATLQLQGISVGNETLTLVTDATLHSSGTFNSWAGNILLNGGPTIRVDGGLFGEANSSLHLSGTVSGGGFGKEGPGILLLTGNNPFDRNTTVEAGILVVNGTQPESIIVVQGGATVAGTGTMGQPVLLTNGELDPGPIQLSPQLAIFTVVRATGILTANGDVSNLTFSPESSFRFQIFGTAAGSQYDRLVVNGVVGLNNATLKVGLSSIASDVGNVFTVITNDGTDAVQGTFNGLPEGAIFTTSIGVQLRVSYVGPPGSLTGNDVTLTHVNTGTMAEDLAVTPEVLPEGERVTLTGKLTDPDLRDRLTLVVDWGDGTRVQRFHPGRDPFELHHRYQDDGDYAMHLSWFDEHGAGNSQNLFVTVHNVAPVVGALGDVTLRQGAVLARGGSFADPGLLDSWTATVDYGDGSGPQPLALNPAHRFTLQHRYDEPGTYIVTVTVRDDDGGEGTATFTVRVLPRPGTDLIDAVFVLFAEEERQGRERGR